MGSFSSTQTKQQTKTSGSSLIGLCILKAGLNVEGFFFFLSLPSS